MKIDLQKEREQRNFWRFKHECFRRGRKDLLREIKRSASSSSSGASAANNVAVGGNGAAVTAAAVSPNAIMSNSSVANSAKSTGQQQQEWQDLLHDNQLNRIGYT